MKAVLKASKSTECEAFRLNTQNGKKRLRKFGCTQNLLFSRKTCVHDFAIRKNATYS